MISALGIDLGTSGVRAAIVDRDAVVTRAVGIAPDRRRDPIALRDTVTLLLDGLDLARVGAVAVDGTSGTMLAVAADGAPLGPLCLYNDPVPPPPDALSHATALPRALALRNTPGIARILHEADWIAGWLAGRFDTADENNALKTGYDPVARAWPDAIPADLRPLLPQIVPAGTVLGPVADPTRFGFASQARVVAGTTDGCASFLAAGAVEPGDAVTALGSSLTLKLLAKRPVFDAAHGIYSHRWLDGWLAGGSSNAGGATLAQFFPPERLAALSARIDPARDSGLDYYPLPRPGERFPVNDPALVPCIAPRPDDDARFLHGLLEGIARIEARGYRLLAEHGAPPVRRVLTVGGGATNLAWTAIRARVLGVPIAPATITDAAVGTARLAARALGTRCAAAPPTRT